MRTKCLSLALAAAALAAPAAHARHAPADRATASPSSALTWTASALEIERLGPKHVPLQHLVSPPPTTVVEVGRPTGFHWADASVGAGVTGLALAVVAALGLVVTRRSKRTASAPATGS
jgi:hypothetical protein